MELDDLITYILLFGFFVLPSLVRRFKGKGPKKEARARRKPGILEKLGTAVQEFVRELENQAREARNQSQEGTAGPSGGGSGKSAWDLLDDRDPGGDLRPESSVPAQASPSGTGPEPVVPRGYDPERPFAAPEKTRRDPREIRRPRRRLETEPGPGLAAAPAPGIRAALPPHALQQAVVWSEILGPPKALKRE